MRLQVRLLAEEEQQIEQLILNKQTELKYLVEGSETNKYPFKRFFFVTSSIFDFFFLTRALTFNYVTYSDIRTLPDMDDQTIIGIKAPPGTRLEVPDPDEVQKKP